MANIPPSEKIEHPEIHGKTVQGHWLPGYRPPTSGKKVSGYQDGRTRFRYLMETYTVEQIDAMVMNKKTRRKLVYRDALLLEEMSISVLRAGKDATARGYSTDDITKARHFVIEQYMGKAAVTVRHGGAAEHGPIEFARAPATAEEAKSAYEMARKRAVKYTETVTDADFTEVAAALPAPEPKK